MLLGVPLMVMLLTVSLGVRLAVSLALPPERALTGLLAMPLKKLLLRPLTVPQGVQLSARLISEPVLLRVQPQHPTAPKRKGSVCSMRVGSERRSANFGI